MFGSVFGSLSSGLAAASLTSRRAFSFSSSLGEKLTTLPGVRSSMIVGVNFDCGIL